MSKIRELIEEKGKILEKMRKLATTDDWTDSVDSEFKDMTKQMSKLDDQINAQNKYIKALAAEDSGEYMEIMGQKRIFSHEERLVKDAIPLSMGHFLSSIVSGVKNDLEDRYFSRALSAGSGSGSYGVPELIGDMIWDKLRAQSVVFQAGAQTIKLNTLTTKFSKITGDAANDGWMAENTTLVPSDPTISTVDFTAKNYAQMITASVQATQDSVNLADVLNTYFFRKFAEAVETAMLVGTGSSNQPRGVYNFTGLGTTLSAVGSELGDYADLIYAKANLEREGAAVNAFITSPEVKRDLDALTDNNGQTIQRPPDLPPIYMTKAIPADVTYGGNTNTSNVLLGDWSKLYLGIRSDITVTVLKERYMDALQYGFLSTLRADVQPSNENAFGRIVAIGAASGAPTT